MARRSSSSDSGGFLFKTGLFALLAGLAYWAFNQFSGKKPDDNALPRPTTELPSDTTPTKGQSPDAAQPSTIADELLPSMPQGTEIVHHTWYALAYDETHEQAAWTVHELTRDRLNENWAERPATFLPDPAVRTESATPRDYNASGYDRGHLVPAADMAFREEAISETFFMSNISPQLHAFNGGVWRELEENTRDWARKFKRLYVVSGPVLTKPGLGQIGFSKVTVPAYFYKILLAPDQRRAIAFIMPNQRSDKPLMDYAVTIDQVEKITGIDFFPKLLKGLDEELEGSLDKDAWPVNDKRYQMRLQKWNNN